MPVVTILQDSAFECNNNPQTTATYIPDDIFTAISDHDLEEVLYACTAGGDVGLAAMSYYSAFISHSAENRQRAIRALVRMEARQTGAA